MKKKLLYSFYLLALLLGWQVSYAQCAYTVQMNDSYGDGWNGNQLRVVVKTGNVVVVDDTITLANGNTGTVNYSVNTGDSLILDYLAGGNYNSEVSFDLIDANNATVYSSGQSPVTGVHFADTVACPSCVAPSNLNATNITFNSVTLSWQENGSASAWNIEYGATGFAQGSGTTVAAGNNPFNLTGLTAATTYDYYVQASCGGSNGNSAWSGPYTFTTACAPQTIPFSDDVESHTSTTTLSSSNCWTANPVGGYDWNITGSGTTPSSSTGPSAAHSGSQFFYVEASGSSTGDAADLYTPYIDLSGATYPALNFYYHMYGVVMGDLYIDILSNGSWTTLDTIMGEQQTASADPWLLRSIPLNMYINDTIQIRFRAISNGSYEGDISIDDIEVVELPTTDIGIIGITSVNSSCGLGMENVSVEIYNYGAQAQSNFNVTYAVNNAIVAIETVNASVAPNSSITYTFTNQSSFSTPGSYVIDAWTSLTGDSDTSNDTLLAGFTVVSQAPSLTFVGNDTINSSLPASETVVCTNGLVPNVPLGACYQLTALVIDSLTHTYNSDLDIYLISPAGDTLEVSTDNGGSTDNYIGVVFTDTATTYITGNNPVPGYYHTEDSLGLAKFNGQSPEGEWKLLVIDDFGGDNGNLYQWHLEFADNRFTVDLGADTNLCANYSITLDAGAGPYTYVWSTGDSTQTITLDTTVLGGMGTYGVDVIVTDTVTGCMVSDSVVLNFTVCIGIEAFTNTIFELYPNPNNGMFNLNVSGSSHNVTIQITSLSGKVVYSEKLASSGVRKQIDLSHVSKGIYFVTLYTDKGRVTEKLIIQ